MFQQDLDPIFPWTALRRLHPSFLQKRSALFNLSFSCNKLSGFYLLKDFPSFSYFQLLKAKSCKELQFQGEKIAAGEFLHSRLSVPTADHLVSGDPFL